MSHDEPAVYSVWKADGGLIQFGFRDARGNRLSVPLTQEQVGAYVLGLFDFMTEQQKQKLRAYMDRRL